MGGSLPIKLMKLDVNIPLDSRLKDIPAIAKQAETIGFDALWMGETQHDPFLAGALAAEHTSRIQYGTAIAVSFARSPAVMAHTAWDLAEASEGRFLLGLGTQVKAHIERRFGMEWPGSVVGKLREQIDVLRAFWHAWQAGEQLNHRGDYYKITLSSPFFTPAPIKYPQIPVYIAGVNTGLASLAGETADGFHVHPFHTPDYLRQVLLPAIQTGADANERKREQVSVVVNAFIITNEAEREFVRSQIAFYASTPSYRKVLAQHGWEEIGEQLSTLASRQQWEEMSSLVDDSILEKIATIAKPGELAAALQERYQGIADRMTVYLPFQPGQRDDFWQTLRDGFPKNDG